MNIELKGMNLGEVLHFSQKLLGPVLEASEFLGDKVRFYRWQSAVKILQRARELAETNGVPVREVPVKFLVPFLEKASLEEEASELVDLWAKLLLSALKEYDTTLVHYTEILPQLCANDAKLLSLMKERTTATSLTEVSRLLELSGELSQDRHFYSNDFGRFSVNKDGVLLLGLAVFRGESPKSDHISIDESLMLQAYRLQQLGLLKVGTRLENYKEDYHECLVWAILTPLGYSFVSACEGCSSSLKTQNA